MRAGQRPELLGLVEVEIGGGGDRGVDDAVHLVEIEPAARRERLRRLATMVRALARKGAAETQIADRRSGRAGDPYGDVAGTRRTRFRQDTENRKDRDQ